MSSRLRTLASAVAAVTGLLLVTAPGMAHAESASPTPSASAAPKSTMTVGWLQDIVSANPFSGYLAEDYELWQLMYPTLANYSAKDFSPVPGLAQLGEESADKKTWTYKITPGLVWSDGQPLTAADAAYTFNRIINGEYEQGNFGGYLKSVSKAEAPDATTLVLTVSKPVAFMRNLPIYILPEHIWKDISEKQVQTFSNEPKNGQPIVGAGPYLLAERKTGQFIRLVANPTSYSGAPAVDEIIIKIYSSAETMAQALKAGEIDFAEGLPVGAFNSLKNQSNITLNPGKYPGFNEIAFNTGAATDKGRPIGDGNPVLKDVAFRQALGWAIDKQALVDKVLGGYGEPADMIMPPMYGFWSTQPANPRTYDPEKAKQLLDAAGYKVGSGGFRTTKDGQPLQLRLMGRSDSNDSKKVVEFVKGYLNDVGINVKVSLPNADVLGEKITAGEFDMFEWGWIPDVDPDYILSIFTCDKRSGDNNGKTPTYNISDSFYCNPSFDQQYDQQAQETDRDARKAITDAMQQEIYDQAPYILTYYYDSLEAYRNDKFTNFTPQPSDGGAIFLQFGTWSYESMKPVSEATDASGTSSSTTSSDTNWALIGGVVIVALALIGLGVGWSRRQRSATEDDRE